MLFFSTGIIVFHKTSFDIYCNSKLADFEEFYTLSRCYRHSYVSEIIQKS